MNKSKTDQMIAELKSAIRGEVLDSGMARNLYSTDASLYQIRPACVAVPRDRRDVLKCVNAARRFGVPLLPRGAGTSLAGQAVSEGLVL